MKRKMTMNEYFVKASREIDHLRDLIVVKNTHIQNLNDVLIKKDKLINQLCKPKKIKKELKK